MRARNLLAWIAVGLVGLALAAGVTYAATQLSSQRIGLSAEPPSAGEELAPPASKTRTAPRTNPVAPSQTTSTASGGGSTSGEPTDDYRGSRTTGPSEEHGEGGGGSSGSGSGGSSGGGSHSGDLDD